MFQAFPAQWSEAIQKAITDAISAAREADAAAGKEPPKDGDPIVLVAVVAEQQAIAAMAAHGDGSTESQMVVNLLTAVIQQQGGSVRLSKKDLAGVDGYRMDAKDTGDFVILSAVGAGPKKLVVAGRMPVSR